MSDTTHIQWTDSTWSPVTGCTKVSDGCKFCYIDRTPPFRMNNRRFNGTDAGATTGVKLHSERLGQPVKWRKPRRIFVCSLADLFQNEVPDRFIADVFAVMSIATQHEFQVLTKRHARLRALLTSPQFWALVDTARAVRGFPPVANGGVAVLGHVWVGVSVENQQWADTRIPALLATPAAVRFLSAEPLLGPIDLTGFDLSGLGWCIAGGESGPGARLMSVSWVRQLVDQCRDADVAPFVKQMGSVWARDVAWNGQQVSRTDPKGGNWDYWPTDLRIRQYPRTVEAVAS